jgi:hypothetical protein
MHESVGCWSHIFLSINSSFTSAFANLLFNKLSVFRSRVVVVSVLYIILSLSQSSEAYQIVGLTRNKPHLDMAARDFPPSNYDYTKSTEENYAVTAPTFVGKYGDLRQQLDYTYHQHYSAERQLLHDKLIDSFDHTFINDVHHGVVCDRPANGNWIVFTAGCMGVGKGHVMRWLEKRGLFPLQSFVIVDPDIIRELLPESLSYNHIDPYTAGYLTQKEVGYISEVLTLNGLSKGKNVLVDGSLRDGEWYSNYLQDLQYKFPVLNIGIVHIIAKLDAILARIERRSVHGRYVPIEVVQDSLQKIPKSIRTLSRFMDMYACFSNEVDDRPPTCKRLWIKTQSQRSLSMDLRNSSAPNSISKVNILKWREENSENHDARDRGSHSFSPNRWQQRHTGVADHQESVPRSLVVSLDARERTLRSLAAQAANSESSSSTSRSLLSEEEEEHTPSDTNSDVFNDAVRFCESGPSLPSLLPATLLENSAATVEDCEQADWEGQFAELFEQHCYVDYGSSSQCNSPFQSSRKSYK